MATSGYHAQFGTASQFESDTFPLTEQTVGLASLVEALRQLLRHSLGTHHDATIPPARQRQHLRKPVAVRASFGGSWGKSDCLVSDLSEGGARVVCGHTPKVGEQVTLECTGNQPLRLVCSVRHTSSTHTGLAFVGVSTESRSRLAELIQAS